MPGTRALPLTRTFREIAAVVRAETPAHEVLRGRILDVLVLSVLVDLVGSGLAWVFEGGHGDIKTVGDALFWTTTQLLTVSSSLANPVTTGGKVLDVALELYAITVVTSVAGMFASFFHHRGRERRTAADRTP